MKLNNFYYINTYFTKSKVNFVGTKHHFDKKTANEFGALFAKKNGVKLVSTEKVMKNGK